ncbi:MAG: class I SAM-dependent methyltransferase [Candidatus Aminicenantes bacterium]|nr:class I SAM-dependent methyltransferase [Candidatus Aminicenantes bacterium]
MAMHKLANTWIGQILNHLVGAFEMRVIGYYAQPELLRLIRSLRREDGRFLFRPSELAIVYSLASACRSISGDFAEVGVFRGTSAKVIATAKGDKSLFLFDTFGGLPLPGRRDGRFRQKQFAASVQAVSRRLQNYADVTIVPGIFPASGVHLRNHHFAFVHLDVDLYASTRDCLEFFYPRMNPGGIILSHDYAQAEGVQRAFDEFFAARPESGVRLPMSQCMVVCGMEMSLNISQRIEALLTYLMRNHSPLQRKKNPLLPDMSVADRSRGSHARADRSIVLHFNAPAGEWKRVLEMGGILDTASPPDRLVMVIHPEGDLYDPGAPPSVNSAEDSHLRHH